MSDDKNEKKVHGISAEYTSVDTLLEACNRVREAGYEKTDAFTPFPVHGIDKALGIKPTVLPWIALGGGLTGTVTALVMQIWMNSINYPYIISGKPYISLPAFIPVSFELTVLFASFGAFFGMWALNKLPRFSNPMFTDPRFDRATDDRFFLFIDADDPRYDSEGVKKLLGDTATEHVYDVEEDDSCDKVPKGFYVAIGTVACLSIIPLLIVAKMRVTNSSSPRIHIFPDMDFSPARDAQQTSTLFADGRAMRPDVPGTVARGQMGEDLDFLTGIDMDELAAIDAPRAQRLVRRLQDPEPAAAQEQTDPKLDGDEEKQETENKPDADEKQGADEKPAADAKPDAEEPQAETPEPAEQAEKESDEKAENADEGTPEKEAADGKPADAKPDDEPAAKANDADDQETAPAAEAAAQKDPAADDESPAGAEDQAAAPPSVMDTTPWLPENPLSVDEELIRHGRKYFEIYCSVCHGMNGGGNGLVNRRAKKLMAATWIPPSALNQESLYADKYPDGKLFNTISNGIRKMPGYASQIRPRDRWAIVAYVRALQLSQDASIDLVPEDQRESVSALQAVIQKKLAEQAEAEKKKEEERAKQAGQKT